MRAALVACLGLFLARSLHARGDSPDAVVKGMTVPPGFRVQLVATEPMVRKPVAIEFDDRGRLWVIQYLQYPNPAGLKRVKVDRYSRTTYDRIPEPPPRGPRGADRITILDDFDANGRARRAKDFVAGLNLASGIALGYDGVFVLQAPYLLFYPDRNHDDVPDAGPEVLLSGFGMEDASAVANSLTWGPDGWLYGCQGSTVTAKVRGVEFQQGVWRYHPVTRRFELFCEGGGNCWGLDFDRQGELFYSTNVGGYCMVHGVQGAYYWKQFGKHGALHNRFAYGYFDHVPHQDFRGGHVTVGGIFFLADEFPRPFRDKFIAADVLGHNVYWHDVEPRGSTFRSRYGGELLLSHDPCFAPSDLTLGPDGAVYVADWHDRRTAHPDPDAAWDRSGGRVFRIAAGTAAPASDLNLGRLPSARLVDLLGHPNAWYARRARRLLAERRDPAVLGPLRKILHESPDDHLALEALWALHVSGGFDEEIARSSLGHKSDDVRRWSVRLIGDQGDVSPQVAQQLCELARVETDVTVRCQMAATAKRLPASAALPLLHELLLRDEDEKDPYIPLLLWWAVEHHAKGHRERVLDMCIEAPVGDTGIVRDFILPRLTRRGATLGTDADLLACARFINATPRKERSRLFAALEEGFQDRAPGEAVQSGTLFSNYAPSRATGVRDRKPINVPAELERLLASEWKENPDDVSLLRLQIRLGNGAAEARARALATDVRKSTDLRCRLLPVLDTVGSPDVVPELLRLLERDKDEAIQAAVLDTLAQLSADEIPAALLRLYPQMKSRAQARAVDLLLSRRRWAITLLREVDRGSLPAQAIGTEQLRGLARHHDAEMDALVRKHWGSIQTGTPEEKLAEMRRLNNDLRADVGDPPRGRMLFRKLCANCHRLFNEGAAVGPDLTHANRADRDYLLVSIVDPSAVIRKEYLSYTARLVDGRALTGLLAEQTPGRVTLLGSNGERTAIPANRIESLEESSVSLMPENLLKDLRPQEVRDLFSYLQAGKPKKGDGTPRRCARE